MIGKIKFLGIISLLGLAATANAENYEWGNVRFDGGGFVSAVIFHPKAENLLYARTDVGGIYRFDFDSFPVIFLPSCNCIATTFVFSFFDFSNA